MTRAPGAPVLQARAMAEAVASHRSRFPGALRSGVYGVAFCVATLLSPMESAKAEANATAPVVEMKLQDFVDAATAHDPGIEAAVKRLEAAEAALLEARFSPYTQFRVQAGVTMAPEARGTPVFSPDSQFPIDNPWRPAFQTRVDGAIPLFAFGKVRSLVEAAKSGVEASEQLRARAEAELIYQIRRAYLSLQLALDLRTMLDEGTQLLQRAHRTLEEARDAQEEALYLQEQNRDPASADDAVGEGAAGTSFEAADLYRLRNAMAEMRARVSEARRLERGARAALGILSGTPNFRIPECPMEALAWTAAPVETLREGVDERPALKALRAKVTAMRAAVRMAYASALPQVGLGLRATYSVAPGVTDQQNPFAQDGANYGGVAGGLFAQWSLDGAGHAARVSRARADLGRAEADLAQARQGLLLEFDTLGHAVEDGAERVAAWGEGYRASRTWFVDASTGYFLGTVRAKELIDAAKAQFSARYNALSATLDHNLGVAGLERSLGQTLAAPEGWDGCTWMLAEGDAEVTGSTP